MSSRIIVLLIVIVIGIVGVLTVSFGISYVYRHYQVWSMEMQGKAKLMEASQTKQIMIETAKAEREAAVERAEAIKIIGEMSKQYPEYRNQEYIMSFGEALKEGKINQIIYVPTEANIPILEAGKR